MLYREQIDKSRVPAHVAIIMDGNGRWAKQRGQIRSFGHQAGAETVHIIAEEAARLGVKYLTLYTFSTENWNRPVDEVAALMSLLMDSIEEESFMKNNISFRIIGDTQKLPAEVLERLNQCIERTSINTGMCLILALSYSSKWELTEAVKQIATKVQDGKLAIENIDDKVISANLSTHFMPDPDLLIRTGGEIRLSNYLLWQCAYSELYFCDTFWPDFDKKHFKIVTEINQQYCVCDPLRIIQCLTVLFDNALKYSTSQTLLIKNGITGNDNFIIVQDQGPGIPEELQKSLFQPFQRGEYAKNINPEGCGLGLSVVKAIMCAHGGDVSYSLTPENGSLFKLSWPV